MRVALLHRFIDIAHACSALNNFNGSMEILSGLESSAVHRLKSTWAILSNKALPSLFRPAALMQGDAHCWSQQVMDIVTNLRVMLSSEKNYQTLRNHLRSGVNPCIPYLGMASGSGGGCSISPGVTVQECTSLI